jgi:predicted Zn-dependent protease
VAERDGAPARHRRSRFARLSGAALSSALALSLGCGTLSIPEERALGEQVNREVRAEARLVKDRVVWDYVREIGHRIVAASGSQPFTYSFYVVEDDAINAFALPGGYIYIHSETILAARNVAELAGVIAHEVGHVALRHVAKNYRRQQGVGSLYRIGVYAASLLGGGLAGSAANLGGGLAAAAYLNSYGRDAEREADAFAVEVMPRAGYDPEGLVTFFKTMLSESGGQPPAWLSSHPTTVERIEKTQRMIEETPLPVGLRIHDDRLPQIQRRIRRLRTR